MLFLKGFIKFEPCQFVLYYLPTYITPDFQIWLLLEPAISFYPQ